jgi:glycosyltransferase involved in cell wall biosynthesis
VFEGLGGTVIEAIQLGKFVVSSDLGGPKETIVDGKTGRLYDGTSVEALTDALAEVLTNPAIIQTDSD